MERHSNVVSRLVGSASTPENLLQEKRKVEVGKPDSVLHPEIKRMLVMDVFSGKRRHWDLFAVVSKPKKKTVKDHLVEELLPPPLRLPLGIPIKIAGESAELQESSLSPVTPLPHYDDS